MYVIGLDVGTTGCKAIVFDLDGNIKGYGFHEYEVICSKQGLAEQDAERVWELTKIVIKKAIEEAKIKSNLDASDIKALSLSVQGDAVIPVNKNILPLYNAILGMDYRTTKESKLCSETFGDKNLFNLTGMRPHPLNSLTKILWFKNNRYDIYKNTYKFMTYADFILTKLGADPVIDYTMASRTMAFNLESKKWSNDILKRLGIEEDKLSKVAASGEIVGAISPTLADQFGLSKRLLLVTGGHDQTCAALGAGVIKDNIAVDSHGTAEVISTAFNRPMLNELMFSSYYPCYCHVIPNIYFTFSLNHIGGILLNWYRDVLGYAEVEEANKLGIDPYELMISKTSKGPSSVLVLPHFNGSGTPWCDMDSKGAFLGLTMATKREDIVKGIMDSLTYELKINLETMKKAGIKINELRTVGGAAKSPIWLQIKADITGFPVGTLKTREAACLGAAILAAKAAGGYSSLEEGVNRTVFLSKIYEPDIKMQNLYNEKFNIYKDIYGTIKNINKAL